MAWDYELARTLRGLGRGGGASPLLEGEVVSTAPLTVSVYNGEVMAPPAPIAVLPGASGYEVRDHRAGLQAVGSGKPRRLRLDGADFGRAGEMGGDDMNATIFPVTPEDIPRQAGTDIGRSPAFDGKTGRFLVVDGALVERTGLEAVRHGSTSCSGSRSKGANLSGGGAGTHRDRPEYDREPSAPWHGGRRAGEGTSGKRYLSVRRSDLWRNFP